MEETFTYDDMNRLTGITLKSPSGQDLQCSVTYDALGRMTSRQAVTSVNGTPQVTTVFSQPVFDATKVHATTLAQSMAELFPSSAQTVAYTGFDKVSKVKQGNDSLCYTYGLDQQRVFMEEHVGNATRTKRYVGNCEYVAESNGSIINTQWLTYLSGPTGLYAVVVTKSGSDQIFYVLKDNLGSWTAITDENGTVEQRMSYDAWGNLRNPNTWSGNFNDTPLFDRGFTGHEHLYDFGLINMNGRMYDPVVSSFLSVDQYVQSPDNAQGFNRYAYCMNNPLKYIDPSGWRCIGGMVGYTPNTASNFDPYMLYGGNTPLVPRDLGIRQFDTTDPIITWMEENSLHSGGNGAKGEEPIIDPSALTPNQQKKFEQAVSFAKDNSDLFKKIISCLENSNITYTLIIGKTENGVPAQFNSSNNSIVFRDEESLALFSAILEELFHAFQLSENKALYCSDEFNFEFEAKVAAYYIMEQLNGLHEITKGTNFEKMGQFISPNGIDVVFPTPQSIRENYFLNGYYEGARFFREWNIVNDYGNENYKKKTLQSPKSLFEMFKP